MFYDARNDETRGEKVLWQCHICKIDFSTREELDKHVMNADCWRDNLKNNKCPMNNCSEKFLTRKELKKHKVEQHSY